MADNRLATLDIVRGEEYIFQLAFTADGVATDITGATIYVTCKNPADLCDTNDDDAVFKITQTTHTNPTGGITTITIPSATTLAMSPISYVYDAVAVLASGQIIKANYGILTIHQAVTLETA